MDPNGFHRVSLLPIHYPKLYYIETVEESLLLLIPIGVYKLFLRAYAPNGVVEYGDTPEPSKPKALPRSKQKSRKAKRQ